MVAGRGKKPPQLAEGLTIPRYYRPVGKGPSKGDPWRLAIWLGVYDPHIGRMGPTYRVVAGRLWVRV